MIAEPALSFGLAGALLVELTIAGRIDIVEGPVKVLDATPVEVFDDLPRDRVTDRLTQISEDDSVSEATSQATRRAIMAMQAAAVVACSAAAVV